MGFRCTPGQTLREICTGQKKKPAAASVSRSAARTDAVSLELAVVLADNPTYYTSHLLLLLLLLSDAMINNPTSAVAFDSRTLR